MLRAPQIWKIVFAFTVLMAHAAWAATTLTMTTEYPATSMPGLGVSTFAELVRGRTKGQVLIDASYDATRGIKSAAMIDAVQARKVDAPTPLPAPWPRSIRYSAYRRCPFWPIR